MPFRSLFTGRPLFTGAMLLLSSPLAAQAPLAAPMPYAGPWAADADGDGRITRPEMTAHMERRFGLMDEDGDGLVATQAMQRMLGHDRPRVAGGSLERHGPGRGSDGVGARSGPGGPPPSGPPPPQPGRAMPYPEDGNDDGQIDRSEFLAPALAMFDDRDRNGDGVLTADELPPPRGRD